MIPIQVDFQNIHHLVKTRQNSGKAEIWDPARKQWVVLQPEEWVRQLLINTLISIYKFPLNRIAVEKSFLINRKRKRFDLVVFDEKTQPYMLIECKAFQVAITQEVFDQLGLYNSHIRAPYLMATNGVLTFCFKQNHHSKDFTFLSYIPNPG